VCLRPYLGSTAPALHWVRIITLAFCRSNPPWRAILAAATPQPGMHSASFRCPPIGPRQCAPDYSAVTRSGLVGRVLHMRVPRYSPAAAHARRLINK
jgi:hypothetical protein